MKNPEWRISTLNNREKTELEKIPEKHLTSLKDFTNEAPHKLKFRKLCSNTIFFNNKNNIQVIKVYAFIPAY